MKLRIFIPTFLFFGMCCQTDLLAQVDEGDATDEYLEDLEYTEEEYSTKFVDAYFFTMFPINTFGDLMNRNLYGFSASYLVERKNSDYNFWGFEIGYNHIGSSQGVFVGSGLNGPFDIEEITSSNLWSVHFLYRIYPDFFFWRIEPFAEAALGTNMFITSTATTFFDNPSYSEFDFDAFNMGLSYGFNVGLHPVDRQTVFIYFKIWILQR